MKAFLISNHGNKIKQFLSEAVNELDDLKDKEYAYNLKKKIEELMNNFPMNFNNIFELETRRFTTLHDQFYNLELRKLALKKENSEKNKNEINTIKLMLEEHEFSNTHNKIANICKKYILILQFIQDIEKIINNNK